MVDVVSCCNHATWQPRSSCLYRTSVTHLYPSHMSLLANALHSYSAFLSYSQSMARGGGEWYSIWAQQTRGQPEPYWPCPLTPCPSLVISNHCNNLCFTQPTQSALLRNTPKTHTITPPTLRSLWMNFNWCSGDIFPLTYSSLKPSGYAVLQLLFYSNWISCW